MRFDRKVFLSMNDRTLIRAIASLALLTLVMGCTGHLNQSNGILGTDDAALPALVSQSQSSIGANEQPSLEGLDRRNWSVVTVAVPRGQVEVQPSYSENLQIAKGTARDAGTFPTSATALEGGSNCDSIVVEGIVQPVWPAALFVAAPVRMVGGEWPWQTQRYPKSKFQLVPVAAASGDSTANLWKWVEVQRLP